MKASSLWTLVRRDVVRARGALATAGFGIAAGTAALVFFLALGLSVRAVLLGDVFPLDRVELEPQARPEPGILALLVGGGKAPPGIGELTTQRVRETPGVLAVYPKLRFAFPSGAFGGKEILGRDMGTHEMLADGIDPALVAGELKGPNAFVDPLRDGGPACKTDGDCKDPQYCELPSSERGASDRVAEGRCSDPIPVLVSPYLVEIFNKGIAPAHGLPQIGGSLLARAEGIVFRLELGVSMMGKAQRGTPRSVRARLVGTSRSAIDLGITLPSPVVKRFNTEYFGPQAAEQSSSLLVRTRTAGDVARVIAVGAQEGLEPKDTHARDVSVLVTSVIGLLTLVATVVLVVAASSIAFTFRVLIAERRAEIGLYRALGATAGDVTQWGLSLALVVGIIGGAAGLVIARVGALIIDALAASKLPDFPFKPASFFAFPPWLLLLGVAAGALFALVGAAGAIRQAARMDPARALIEP